MRGGDALPAPGVSQAHRQLVVAHYERQLQRHGPTAMGMDWKDERSQELRFEMLCAVGELDGKSVHEIGAGAGHLCDFLRSRGIAADYSGSDLSADMVEVARRLHPDISFEQRDVLGEAAPGSYDFLLCSGLFHVKLDSGDADWRSFVKSAVRRMYEMCRESIAFNMMSDQVDYRSELLYYSNPREMLDFCRRELSRSVVLRDDYPLHEYTIYVDRRAQRRPTVG